MSRLPLRDYQQKMLDYSEWSFNSGKRAIVWVMPTGAGKTKTFAEFAMTYYRRNQSVLFVAHRKELIQQAYKEFILQGVTPDVIGDDAANSLARNGHRIDRKSRVTLASIATLLTRGERPEADLLGYDEAHRSPSDKNRNVVSDYAHKHTVGLTATPERADGTPLGDLFDDMIESVGVMSLIRQGHLVNTETLMPQAKLGQGQIALLPIDAYRQYAGERKTMVFCRSIQHAKDTADTFLKAGISTAVVHSELEDDERDAIIDDYVNGKYRVICNSMILTEGFDDPATSCIIIARPCQHVSTYVQICGRVLRKAPGKKNGLIIDLSNATMIHGDIQTERRYSLLGRPIEPKDKRDMEPCERLMGASEVAGVPLVRFRTPVELFEASEIERLALLIAESKEGAKEYKGRFLALYRRYPTEEEITAAAALTNRVAA